MFSSLTVTRRVFGRFRAPLLATLAVACSLAAVRANAGEADVVLSLARGTLLFAEGSTVTDEYAGAGVVLSSAAQDLAPEYRGTGQPNVVSEGTLYNVHRIFFLRDAVHRASVILSDQNGGPQTHSLVAFDRGGRVVDRASFYDDGELPSYLGVVRLSVASRREIASVVVLMDPPGAQAALEISYGVGRR